MAKEAFYFSHDSNARNDQKILAMMTKYQWHGYGLYWAIVEIMREHDKYMLSLDKYTYDALALQLHMDASAIENFVSDCINEFKLFVVENGFILSKTLIRRMDKKDEISSKRSKAATKRWNKNNNINANALQNNNSAYANKNNCNAIKEKKEIKVKEIKVNTIPQESLDFLKEGIIQPQEFFKNFPYPGLNQDSEEIIKKLITTKNPKSKLEPDEYQLSIIKKHLLIYPDQKEILLKSIEGAEIGDKIKKDCFEIPNLTVDYIINPKNQSRLIGYWDTDQNDKEDQYPSETNEDRELREQKENANFKTLPTPDRVNFLIKGNMFSMFSQLKEALSESKINELTGKLLETAGKSDDLTTCALSFSQIITEHYQQIK